MHQLVWAGGLCWWHTVKKLVQESCTSRPAQETCTSVAVSCTSFFLYRFHAPNTMQLYCVQETCMLLLLLLVFCCFTAGQWLPSLGRRQSTTKNSGRCCKTSSKQPSMTGAGVSWRRLSHACTWPKLKDLIGQWYNAAVNKVVVIVAWGVLLTTKSICIQIWCKFLVQDSWLRIASISGKGHTAIVWPWSKCVLTDRTGPQRQVAKGPDDATHGARQTVNCLFAITVTSSTENSLQRQQNYLTSRAMLLVLTSWMTDPTITCPISSVTNSSVNLKNCNCIFDIGIYFI